MLLCEAFFLPMGIFIANIDNYEPGWDIVIIFGFSAFPLFLFGLILWSICSSAKRILNGSYKMILDTVERVVTDELVGSGKNRHYEHAMYLWLCGRVVISLQDTYLNTEGDKCYVLVFDDGKNTPVAVYNTKFYELEDIEAPSEEVE